jgi:hypothetical protein
MSAIAMKDEENLFFVNVGWVQEEAMKRVNRKLTYFELQSVKKGLEWGLTWDIDTVFETAITDAVEMSKKERRMKSAEKSRSKQK